MNIWKSWTIALVLGLTFVVGGGAFSRADAARTGGDRPASIGYDWGQEQPRMEEALRELRGARHSLEAAGEHKGGWRALALKHTDEAINETIRGMEYAKNHPKD